MEMVAILCIASTQEYDYECPHGHTISVGKVVLEQFPNVHCFSSLFFLAPPPPPHMGGGWARLGKGGRGHPRGEGWTLVNLHVLPTNKQQP